MKPPLTALVISVVAASPAFAESFQTGDLTVTDPVVFATPQSAKAGGGFMTIANASETDDRLLEVRADYPRVEIHNTEMDGDVAKMVHIGALELPANETVTLQPGALHVMFMGLPAPFIEGETIPATLVFEQAGELDIEFEVVERPQMSGMSHGN